MYSILFVCTGNHFRSPIAAETFRKQLVHDKRDKQWIVTSAGTWTTSGQHVFPVAVELAHSLGVDISNHMTNILNAKMLDESDLVLVMEAGHKESIQVEFPSVRNKVYLLSEVVDGIKYDVPDPASAKEESREIIRDLISMIRTGAGNIYRIVKASKYK